MSVSAQVVLGSLAIVAAFGVAYWALSGERATNVDLASPTTADPRRLRLAKSGTERTVTPLLERLGHAGRRFVPTARLHRLEQKLQQIADPSWTVERVVALKVAFTLLLGLFALVLVLPDTSAASLLMIGLALAVGWFGPDAIIDRKVDERKYQIRRDVADTIDQLNVMVRAGLGIDAAISRIATHGQGPLSDEFARVMQDMRFGLNRQTALHNMAERVDLSELRGFVAALSQADQLGVPISDTLRSQAEELRDRRRKSAEEQAMKLPVKMLLPMVLCMLPVLFIVILGPAVINIFDVLGD